MRRILAYGGVGVKSRNGAALAHPLLETRQLTKSFRGLVALDNHCITIDANQIIGLIGPNGSGKSTFLNLVTGFLKADAGSIVFAGRPIQVLAPADIARLGIARTFQGIRLFGQLSVLENLMAAVQLRHPVKLYQTILKTPPFRQCSCEIEEAARALLERIGLQDQAHRRASELSYGDQRRLELARALATKPKLLLLDEPAAGINARETRALLELIVRLRQEDAIAVVVVEHNMDLIMNLCERIQVLAHGQVIFEGTPQQVQSNPKVREAYLGRA